MKMLRAFGLVLLSFMVLAFPIFAENGCGLAIEFKKFWMDEWSGQKDEKMAAAIHEALSSTVPGVLEELRKL